MNPLKKLALFVLGVLTISSLIVFVPEYVYSQQALRLDALESQNESINQVIAVYYGKQLSVPSVPSVTATKDVLGTTNEEKIIKVDLTNQRLYAYEGDQKIYEFLISSGKWGRTPVGEFTVWHKVESTRMRGGSKELHTYYDLPNVPYTMFFYNKAIPQSRGYGIHGAYWHNSFGKPMSHGCINMKPEEAAVIYQWATPIVPEKRKSTSSTKDNPGTKIIIFGKAPLS